MKQFFQKVSKKALKKIIKQNKDIKKLEIVINQLENNNKLDSKYKNHKLKDTKIYKDCYECHIEPDWLLIYKYEQNELLLLLIDTGTHSDLFNL